MIDYVTSEDICRNRILLSYFGEKCNHNCGICDICISKKDKGVTISIFNEIQKSIKNLLNENELSTEEIVNALNFPEHHIIEVIRFLIDENYIKDNNGKLKY